MAVALVVLCGIIGTSNADFYGTENIQNVTRQVAMLGTFAIGVSFVIITGGIDLSVGSVIGLSGVIIAKLSAPAAGGGWEWSIGWGIAAALAAALAIGLAQGLLITRLGLQSFIVTLGGMLLIRGVAQTIAEGGNISFGTHPFTELGHAGIPLWATGTTGAVDEAGSPVYARFHLPYPMIIFIAVLVAGTYLLHFTVFGRYIYAIGGNRDAAQYSGVPVRRVETLTYVISAGLAGLAGIPYAAYIGQMNHTVGTAYELTAIAAAVLGGCSLRGGEGVVLGVFVGSAIMMVMENGINMFKVAYTDAAGAARTWRLDDNWKFIIIGGVILGAVVLDQVTHLLQDRRRKRRVEKAGAAPADRPTG
jgi:ribose transport system permease protein